MSTQQPEEIVRRFVDEVYNAGNLDVIDEVVAPAFVNHDPANPAVTDVQTLRQEIIAQRAALPDLHVSIDDLVIQGDKVAKRSTTRGTSTGEWHGIPPTGREIELSTLSLYRVADGKIQEIWWGYDVYGLLQQMGVIPAAEQAGV